MDEAPTHDIPVDQGQPPVDVDAVVDKTVRRVYQDSIATKYVECPGCGNLILRKYGECHKCRLRYNPVDQSWIDAHIPSDQKPESDDESSTLIL